MTSKSSRPPATVRRPIAALPSRSSAPPKVYDETYEGTETDQTAVVAPKSFRTARRPTLMAMAGSLAGNVFRVGGERLSIGRSKTASITLSDQGVSRIHCVVTGDGQNRYFVEDQESTNGTIVNGAMVTRVQLSAGDRIQVGAEAVFGEIRNLQIRDGSWFTDSDVAARA